MASFYYTAYRSLYSVVRFGARFAVFAITGLALLGAGVVALTQLESFRSWAIGRGLEALNGELQGKVSVGDVSGNFITGLDLLDVRLMADSTTVLEAPLVELNYLLEPIFADQIVGARAIIHNPEIRLVRNRVDSVWNFERITKPAKDSIKTPFNWSIDLSTFEIVDAKVYVHDLTAQRQHDTVHNVNFQWLELEKMNLSMQAHIAPTSQSIWIQNLSFDMPQPDIRLIELAGTISIDTTGLTVKDLNIETSRSLIALDGHLDSLNVLGMGKAVNSWQKHPLKLDLRAERVSTVEIKRFIPEINFLAGSPSLELSIDGLFEDLNVSRLNLGLTHGNIAASGRIRNLQSPDSLWIDARLGRSLLTYRDVPLYVPGLGLPDLGYLGDVKVESASFKGYTDEFVSTLDAQSAVGSVRGGARLDLRGSTMAYAADLAVADANLEPIMGDRDFASNFTGRMVINGRGTTLKDVDARFRLESQASTIAGRTYRKLYAGGRVSKGGRIDADTILVAWGPGATTSDGGSSIDLDRLPQLLSRGMESSLENQLTLDAADRQLFATSAFMLGAGGILDLNRKSYKLHTTGRNFDPARLTLDDSQHSSLTFYAEVDGQGFDPDAIRGEGYVTVTSASIAGKTIPAFAAHVNLQQDGSENRTLSLQSDIADAEVTGRWRFESIVPAVSQGFSSIANYVGRKAQYRSETMYGNGRAMIPINAEYSLTLKNLAPLQLLMPGTTLVADGTVNGDIAGTGQTMNITVNADLKTFRYSSGGTSLSLPSTRARIDLRNITPGHIEDLTTAEVSIQSDSLVKFNDLTFTVPDIDVRLENGEFKLHGATAINNSITLALDGAIDVRDPGGYRVRFDTLLVGIPNGPQYHNVRPVSALISGEEIRVDTLVMQRDRFEVVSITGALVGDRFRDVVVDVERGSLRSISRLAGGGSALESLGGNLREGTVRLNGTFDDPQIDASFEIDSLSFGGNIIGDFRSDIYYMDRNLTGRVTILDALRSSGDTTHTNAEIDIRSLPIDLALASREERFIKGEPVEIVAETHDLPIAFASAFLPGIRFLEGTADLKFAVNGKYPTLTYSGDGAIRRGRILVEANNVTYFMSAGLKFQEETLSIQRLSLRNDPRDLVNSSALIDGTVKFKGLEPQRVDFNAKIDRLLVLSDATQAVNSTVYGDLVIASGENDISFSGPLTGPKLKGDVVILNGNLTLPQDDQRLAQSGVVKYVEYKDWIKLAERPFGPSSPFDEDNAIDTNALDSIRTGSLEAASRGLQGIIDSVQGRSTGNEVDMIDLIELDSFRIFISGRLFVRVDFSPIEQLRGEIGDGGSPIRISKKRNRGLKIGGTLVLKEGSDFTFIKKFDADGYITFRDDIENPEFDVTARHNNRRLLDDGTSEEFEVIARISGNKERPDLTLDYTIDNRPSGDATKDQKQRNAIALLLFGRTSEELAGSGVGGHVSTLLGSVAGSSSSSLVSSILNEAFTTTGFIRSFDIDLGGNPADISQARVNGVFQFGKIIVRYGGQVSSPNNGIITVDAPLALLTDAAFWRNISLQFQREVQSLESTNRAGSNTSETETIRFRVQYRITW
jgi:hypothetical protein